VSVLREDFTDNEKKLLRRLVRGGRKLDDHGQHRNPVLLMAAMEGLGFRGPLSNAWKDKGGKHAKFGEFNLTHGLYAIAESTVGIYLDLPTYQEEACLAR
jgi:hypothetical protein